MGKHVKNPSQLPRLSRCPSANTSLAEVSVFPAWKAFPTPCSSPCCSYSLESLETYPFGALSGKDLVLYGIALGSATSILEHSELASFVYIILSRKQLQSEVSVPLEPKARNLRCYVAGLSVLYWHSSLIVSLKLAWQATHVDGTTS